jgi:hypothetical protein
LKHPVASWWVREFCLRCLSYRWNNIAWLKSYLIMTARVTRAGHRISINSDRVSFVRCSKAFAGNWNRTWSTAKTKVVIHLRILYLPPSQIVTSIAEDHWIWCDSNAI